MVDEFKTEEEQIAAIKNWWKNNGTSVILAIVAALAIVFGYSAWQSSVETTKSAASGLYQQLVNAVTSSQGLGNEDSISFLAEELKDKYDGSEYARFGALFLAKVNVENGKLDEAINELDYVLASTEDIRTTHIVTARKARILAEQGKFDEALSLLTVSDDAFKPTFLEVQADIKLAQGDMEAAKSLYLEAYDLVKETPQQAPLLGVKLSDLGVDTRNL